MEDTILAAPAAVPATVADPTAPSAQPVIDPARTALINKYEALYAPPEPTVVAEPITDPTVVATAVETPVTVVDPNTVLLQQLTTELAALKAQMQPATPAPVTPAATQEDWLKLLSEGKKAEGEKAMADLIRGQLNLNEIQSNAVTQAVQVLEAKQQIDNFINTVKSAPENADVLVMEPYITAAVSRRYDEAIASGKVKSPADSVTVYKAAVTAEIEIARNLALALRGAGATAAQTRTQQVAAAQTIRPNAVNLQREQTNTQQASPEVDPTTAYLAERAARSAKLHGLTAATA